MKKILFAAVLFAGTTLGFAKDNVKKTEVEVTKTEVVAKNQQNAVVLDKETEASKKIRVCTDMFFWTTTEEVYHPMTNTTTYHEVSHIATINYLCTEDTPRMSVYYGNPGL